MEHYSPWMQDPAAVAVTVNVSLLSMSLSGTAKAPLVPPERCEWAQRGICNDQMFKCYTWNGIVLLCTLACLLSLKAFLPALTALQPLWETCDFLWRLNFLFVLQFSSRPSIEAVFISACVTSSQQPQFRELKCWMKKDRHN